jgi:hypothetical protein
MPTKISLKEGKESPLVSKYETLEAILSDHELAALGDAYVNFVYSLALSRKKGKPAGKKVNSSILASALKKADLRRFLPSRTDRHRQADSVESLIVYAWLAGAVSLDEALCIMEKEEKAEDAFALLLRAILDKLNVTRQKV